MKLDAPSSKGRSGSPWSYIPVERTLEVEYTERIARHYLDQRRALPHMRRDEWFHSPHDWKQDEKRAWSSPQSPSPVSEERLMKISTTSVVL